MTQLTQKFTAEAGKTTNAFLAASLSLIGADTRKGIDAPTAAALAVVAGASEGHAGRTAYMQRFTAAAGSASRTSARAAFQM